MIYFVGAGPGDPGLLTVRGKELIDTADVIIYAGSLVNPEILKTAKKEAAVYNSAYMTLPQLLTVMEEADAQGRSCIRLHTGDPSIYGAVREQMDALSARGIAFEVVAGVSSFLGAAASLQCEYTLPDVSQTVILTRMEGRTQVPAGESIEALAAHRASMVVFLSVDRIDELSQRLQAGGYPSATPAAVVYRATWEDERIVRGTLADITLKSHKAGITRTALVMVGDFLGDTYGLSRLYDGTFTTGYRQGSDQEERS